MNNPTLPTTPSADVRDQRRVLIYAIIRIAFFVVLLTLAAKIRLTIPGNPIPITLQTVTVLLAGFLLGSREGTLSVIAYVGLITLGAPLDALGSGSAAMAGPTAGYLIGFIPAAFIAGLAAHTTGDVRRLLIMTGCGVLASIVLLACGSAWYALFAKLEWRQAALAAIYPFILIEPAKAAFAAGLAAAGREWITRRAPHLLP